MIEQTVVTEAQPVWTNKAIKQMLNELAETRLRLSEAKAENKSHLETIYKFSGDMMAAEGSLAILRTQYDIVADQRDNIAAELRDTLDAMQKASNMIIDLTAKLAGANRWLAQAGR